MRGRIIGLMMLFALTAVSAFAQTDPKAKAEEVLKQARATLGDEAKIKTLQGLAATGTMRRTFGEMQMESEIEIEIALPDKIRRTENSQRGTNVQVLNAGQIWNEFIPAIGGTGGLGGPGGGFGGGGGNVIVRGAGGGPGGGQGGQGGGDQRMQAQQRNEFVRLTLGWLLAAPGGLPVEFAYAGEAKSPDGTADAINVKGPEGIIATLFFDQKTHQLLMLNYKGKQFSQMMRGGRGPGGGPGGPGGGQAGQAGAPPNTPPPQLTPEEIEKRRKEREEAMAKLPDVEFRWVFADYKTVNGISLPHRLTKLEAGKPNEEWQINKFKVNPNLKPEKFVKKEEKKP